MWRITCHQCGASAITQDGNTDVLACPCCPEPHSHEANAGACPGAGRKHDGAECAHPDGGKACNAVTPLGKACPGGHCHVSMPDCQVCRPVDLAWLGTVQLGPVVVRA